MTGRRRYGVRIDAKAAKLLRKLDQPAQAKLVAAIAALAGDPRPPGVKPLSGHPGPLRIRVGSYRVVYTVNDGILLVLVVHLGHRGKVYDTH